jgi:MFS family permease
MLQNAPILLISWFTTRFEKLHRRLLPEAKRKAVLKRRGLFDFVSPVIVLLAVLANFQFVAFMFYVERHPFPDFGGPFLNIGIVWLGYVLLGAFLYWFSRRKKDPLQTHAERMFMIRAMTTAYVWVCILVPVTGSITVARKLVDLEETWGPLAGTVFFLLLTLFNLRTMAAPPLQPEAQGLGTSPVR